MIGPDGIDNDSVRIEVKRIKDEYGVMHTIIEVHDKDGYIGGASGSTFAQAVTVLAHMFGVEAD